MEIKKYQELSVDELYDILSLRNEVFIVEQNCVYQDIDYIDQSSYHVYIKENNKIIAYARLIEPGITYKDSLSIGRVLVKKDNRKQGLANDLLLFVIEQASLLYPSLDIAISAQSYLLNFYSTLGFKQVSEEYLEDGIPHIKMILTN